MKKGFTLIELLAVIVILAIIAVIAVPIVLNIISDTKESASLRSADFYLDAVEISLANSILNNKKISAGVYSIMKDGNICIGTLTDNTCDGDILEVEVKGEKPISGELIIEGIEVKPGTTFNFENISLVLNKDNKIVDAPPEIICTAVDSVTRTLGTIPSNNSSGVRIYRPGDEYICEVKEGIKYHFYVLSVEQDNVNLIMDKNICEDGTLETSVKPCTVLWISEFDFVSANGGSEQWTSGYETGSNSKGPLTAMSHLYKATKDWEYVSNMVMNYSENSHAYTDGSYGNIVYGYGGIVSTNGIATFTDYSGKEITKIGTIEEPLKARLLYSSEAKENGCTETSMSGMSGNCPQYLSNFESYTKGHWTISSYMGSGANRAWVIDSSSLYEPLYNENGYGVRPVIMLPKSRLK